MFRNGYVLCEIIYKLFDFEILNIFKQPKSYTEIKHNFHQGIEVLKNHFLDSRVQRF